MTWRLIEDEETNIYRNLAIEEAIAKVCARSIEKMNTLRFWRSSTSAVMGRFQCVHEEVNLKYCDEHNIPIGRRFTGGGTVYHDEGNMNFSICVDQNEPYVTRTLDELYWNFVGGMAAGLQKIGVPARFDSQRSCIRINRKKITGTAGWSKRGVSFLHGTLLIDSDLEKLSNVLTVPPNQPKYYRDRTRVRCKKSRRDAVTSIALEMPERPPDEKIKQALIQSVEHLTGCNILRNKLTQDEMRTAESLFLTKYSKSEWNLGILANDI